VQRRSHTSLATNIAHVSYSDVVLSLGNAGLQQAGRADVRAVTYIQQDRRLAVGFFMLGEIRASQAATPPLQHYRLRIPLPSFDIYTMASFPDLAKPDGLKALDEYLLTRSYITGYAIPSQRVF
jgi:hypothetical protein